MTVVYLTHFINIAYSLTLAYMLLGQNRKIGAASRANINRLFGTQSPARNLVGSIYISVAMVSVLALLWHTQFVQISTTIFMIQMSYKFFSAFLLRPTPHPIAVYNILLMVLNATAFAILM